MEEMAFDHNGEQLVVSFKGDAHEGSMTEQAGAESVAAFIVRPTPYVADPKNPLMPMFIDLYPSFLRLSDNVVTAHYSSGLLRGPS
jgi:hypothetical protein